MFIIDLLLRFYFGSTSLFAIVGECLFIAGLTGLFRKSGIPVRWAFIPFARIYMFSLCAGREVEGRLVSVLAFSESVFSVVSALVEPGEGEELSALYLLFTGAVLVLSMTELLYSVRIFQGMLEVYGGEVKHRFMWILMWLLFEGLTALIWGYSKKFQPEWQVEDIRRQAVLTFSGKDAKVMDEGLTVNLTERTATEFFQKKCLLRDIHMYIPPKHMVLLLGGSGAGKTTFLNAVNGYEQAKAKVTLNGGDVYAEYDKMKYQVGFVPQQELMRGKDTVYHTLMDAAVMRLPSDVSSADRRRRVEEVMEIFGLAPVRDSLVDKLSGGQKKRLSIAMEFIPNPSLFILDEPDSGLDGVMARELFEQLRMLADQGKIVMVITHTPDRVIDLFDDVIVLAKDKDRTGRLAYYGSTEDARTFFGKEKMEQIVMSVNRPEEGGEGRADEFVMKYAEVQNG